MKTEWIRNYCTDSDEFEVVNYGLAILVQILLGILLAAIVGVFFGCLQHIILFIFFFVPIRINAGGIHMRTSIGCLTFSTFLFCLIAVIFRFFPNFSFPYVIIFIMISILYAFSPVENKNKKLFFFEKRLYRRRVLITIVFEMIIYLVANYNKLQSLIQIIQLSIVIESISVLLGKFEIFKQSGDNNEKN